MLVRDSIFETFSPVLTDYYPLYSITTIYQLYKLKCLQVFALITRTWIDKCGEQFMYKSTFLVCTVTVALTCLHCTRQQIFVVHTLLHRSANLRCGYSVYWPKFCFPSELPVSSFGFFLSVKFCYLIIFIEVWSSSCSNVTFVQFQQRISLLPNNTQNSFKPIYI